MKRIFLFLICFLAVFTINAQPKPIYLWKDISEMAKEKTRLYIYEAPDSIQTGVSVIVCPGGSYHHLGMFHEGYEVAEWLNNQGITAFVLRYRVGCQGYHHPAMLQDVQRAIQFVKEHMEYFKLKTLGIMGFSAGGHLASMAAVFYKMNSIEKYTQSKVNLRPDFVVPVYPVVSMQDSLTHLRSRKNLLGKHFDKDMIDQFSMELQIPNDMPPVFLVAAKDDPVVNYHNSVELEKALKNKQITNKFILYETGGHGFGMNEKRGGETAKWKLLFKEWLIENEFIK
ncbi:MAG: alpha/beta hydrolase [Bacteroidales bacterium]|nr:alpha/beta hydrolase [Bacteroidales bacterium]MDD4210309.1 alpha/beta hydrolase [Bacteroidales bacterium]